jgi:hypothetical protein
MEPESIEWLERRLRADSEIRLAPTFDIFATRETAIRVHIVLNWFEELKRLVPAGK